MSMILAWLGATRNLAIPIVLSSLGGLLSEKVGVAALSLEGLMLAAAFTAVRLNGGYIGLIGGSAVAIAIACVQFYLIACLRIRDIIVCLFVNMFVLALTNFIERVSPSMSDVTTISPVPCIIITLSLCILIGLVFTLRKFSLPLGLVGESALQATILGYSVKQIRFQATIGMGLMAGVGGAMLPLMSLGLFTENMTQGRGYLALAAIVFGRWKFSTTLVAALVFSSLDALQLTLSAQGVRTETDLLEMIPYIVGIIALAVRGSKDQAPKELERGGSSD